MRRSKQVENMIARANEVLEANRVTDLGNPLFNELTWLLLETGLYKGYNSYHYNEAGIKCIGETADSFLQIL